MPLLSSMFPSFRAPETMTADEQAALLRAMAAHNAHRDHVLYSVALGTGLRLRELLGLDVGDVSPDQMIPYGSLRLESFHENGGHEHMGNDQQ